VILALVAFGLLGVTGCATTRGVPSGASLVTEATPARDQQPRGSE
jgi:hypothetical protein